MYRLLYFFFLTLCLAACHTNKPVPADSPVAVETPASTSSSYLSAVEELTDDNFSDKMKTGEGLRMAYFTATWCGPCRVLSPTIDKVSANYRGEVLMGKMDVDANLVDAFNNITTVPTILFFKDGEEVFRTHGIVSEEYLTEVIERLR